MGLLRLFLRLPSPVRLGLVAALAIGVLQWRHGREVRGLQQVFAATAADLRDAQATQAILSGQLVAMTANRDRLVADVQAQRDAIAGLQLAGQRAAQAASLAAVRVLRDGASEAVALRTEPARVPAGHEALNAWLAERFR